MDDSLTLLAVTDVHGALTDWDYVHDRPTDEGGLARVATVVREIRAVTPSTVLLDCGDSIQGNPLTALYASEPDGVHPVADVLNHLGVDAAALGNHDLDYGLERLSAYAADCDFPVLAANLSPIPGVASRVILDRTLPRLGPLRLGVVGLSTPGVILWNATHLAGRVSTRGIVEVAAEQVRLVRQEGADLVVVLSHSGMGPGSSYGDSLPWPENDTRRLIREVPGIDAVVLGHAHEELSGHERCVSTGQLVPYVEPSCMGLRLGRIDLRLRRAGDGITVVDSVARTLPTQGTPDSSVTSLVSKAHGQTRARLAKEIGVAAAPVPASPVAAGPSPMADLLNHVQAEWATDRLAGTPYAELPVISAAALHSDREGLRTGPVRVRDLHRIAPFENRLHALELTARDVLGYLEHNARYFGPERIADFNHEALGAATARVSYSVDPGAPVGSRVSNLRIDGQAPAPEQRLVLVVSSYRASGGGGFPATAGNQPIVKSDEQLRELLAAWIGRHTPLSPAAINRSAWEILPHRRRAPRP
ncbi:bifunctional UDP-sugar hydrolase/5'-nucleotidase [Blastococcus sp. Marseille-P5729]|uniref:bifunctional metallophosphatase/5'-nucleotidase n=1 Tax=Blastococcus sp. Marseille-P5729 TaxID=2086582 RepID=UPI00131BCD25|nr:5'-nucleotidase C-terminal domain-containing protein [Blastococcus sp. Marseille-P5729]